MVVVTTYYKTAASEIVINKIVNLVMPPFKPQERRETSSHALQITITILNLGRTIKVKYTLKEQ